MTGNRDFTGRLAVLVPLLAAFGLSVVGAANAQGDAAVLERGEKLFKLCSACHGAAAAGNEEVLAPAIAGMPDWYVTGQLNGFRQGRRGTHFDDISGMRMRPMALTLRSEEDVQAVAKYVSSLPPTRPEPVIEGGDAGRGATIYAQTCTNCHGETGAGNEALLGASPLANTSDWYLVRQIEYFRAGIRGTRPGDPGGAMMRPMALALGDEQAIKDVVAHIMTLSK